MIGKREMSGPVRQSRVNQILWHANCPFIRLPPR
jgi:hypothetical protein